MFIIIFWIACAIIGAMIGSGKGSGGAGFFLGLLLGPIGVIIVAVMKGNKIDCPYCKSKINPEATVCPNCQKNVA